MVQNRAEVSREYGRAALVLKVVLAAPGRGPEDVNWDNIGLLAPVSTGQHPIRMVPQLTILHTARANNLIKKPKKKGGTELENGVRNGPTMSQSCRTGRRWR